MNPANPTISVISSDFLNKLEVLTDPGVVNDDHCKTFVLNEEDHTLANPLRYMIMKNPNVIFCAYTIPHPSETKVNLRIQTTKNITAMDALETGLKNLNEMCKHILKSFETAYDEFVPMNSIN